MEHHHPIVTMLRGYRGRLQQEREIYGSIYPSGTGSNASILSFVIIATDGLSATSFTSNKCDVREAYVRYLHVPKD